MATDLEEMVTNFPRVIYYGITNAIKHQRCEITMPGYLYIIKITHRWRLIFHGLQIHNPGGLS